MDWGRGQVTPRLICPDLWSMWSQQDLTITRLQNLLGRQSGGECFPRGCIQSLYTGFMIPGFPWAALVISP